LLLSFGLYFAPRQYKAWVLGGLSLLSTGSVLVFAFKAILLNELTEISIPVAFWPQATLVMDRLSALFVMLASVVFLATVVYTHRYYDGDAAGGNLPHTPYSFQLQLMLILYYAVVLVACAQNAFVFLSAWELMTVCTFLLSLYQAHKRTEVRAALSFFIQMHVGFLMLALAFGMVANAADSFSFDAVRLYFSNNDNLLIFLLFFAAFGMKAGMAPLHAWLPEFYASIPGNLSGLISGVVSSMGIYGLARVLTLVQGSYTVIAVIIIAVSVFSAIYGVILAAIQKDVKKLLAYSSVDNMGIVGIALGMAVLGKSYENSFLMLTGFSAALLHTFSHGMLKALLFMSVSRACDRAGTQNLDKMGGIIKHLPHTSLLFLLGGMGICALPPFSGFVSEFVLYSGAINSLSGLGYGVTAFSIVTVVVLSLVGGISLLAYSKAFGVGFLGQAREQLEVQVDNGGASLYALLIPAVVVVLLGVFPVFFVKPVYQISTSLFPSYDAMFIRQSMLLTLGKISMVVLLFTGLVAGVFFLRRYFLRKRTTAQGTTWACGSTTTSPKIQYTAASYAAEFAALTKPTSGLGSSNMYAETDFFPVKRKVETRFFDLIMARLRPYRAFLSRSVNRLAIFQTGHVHHYILYALLFIILVFALTFVGWI
jgi:formate hydrogenlyase subunit 3/multisubunit Na+/H+ antiporter MnhD subunit